MKTSNNICIPQGTIPSANQFSILVNFAKKAKQERADARSMARIQKAFQRAVRFGQWKEKITLWGITYRVIYTKEGCWIQQFLSQNGYEIIQLDENMSEAQFSRALSKPLRVRIER